VRPLKNNFGHDHALYSAGGKLVDPELPIPDGLLQKAGRLSKFEPASIEVTLRGLCEECRKCTGARLIGFLTRTIDADLGLAKIKM